MGLTTERWKLIPGFLHYEASSLGRIRTLDRRTLDTLGRRQKHRGRMLSLTASRQGYLQVLLYQDGIRRSMLVHRLVATAWLGECPDGMEVNHKNCNKADNRIGNLEYVTPSENVVHSFDSGRSARGEDHRDNKLSVEQVRSIRAAWESGSSTQTKLAEKYGVSPGTIHKIVSRKRWRWLT